MKLWLLLALSAVVAAAPQMNGNEDQVSIVDEADSRNLAINILGQLFAYLRRIINNGSAFFGLPPLDPLQLDGYRLELPAGLINLDLQLKDILVTGIGGFVVRRSDLRISDLTFNIDISVPRILIKAGVYDLDGDLFGAIPLYGNGRAEFIIENFRLSGLLHLKRSEDGESVVIDRIENPTFDLPSIESNLDGVIGGGDIDAIVNAVISEVIVDYVNRFRGVISKFGSEAMV
ncbi:uncharacterized protein [Epargyreus clarus]|uniref:uncharacterized protein n=1 Tax=Epargyreus clarus TaxID=520877 RepID=UPI003C2CDE97